MIVLSYHAIISSYRFPRGRQFEIHWHNSRGEEGIIMSEPRSIDHITLCVENLDEAEFLFTKVLGFEVIWSARDVGTDKSSMDTVVVQCGAARIALMQGRDKAMKSQITDFIEKYGQGVQHVALEVDDIEAVCREWEAHGVKFSGPVKEGRDGFGPLKQRFTYPLFPGGGLFIELTQREHGEERAKTFVRSTVEALYKDIERDQASGAQRTIIDYGSKTSQRSHPSLKKAS
jgi:methylmalonyl-CoA/ethylmalonyl-CoA epimerase